MREMTEIKRMQRNLNPHAEARMAMWLYAKEYSQQRDGSMDFWDKLDVRRKRLCREAVNQITGEARAADSEFGE